MEQNSSGPVEIELEELPELSEPDPAALGDGDPFLPPVVTAPARRGSRVTVWVLRFLGALISLAFGVWAWDFVADLLLRNSVLGGVALALVVGFVGFLLIFTLREIAALSRLDHIDGLRAEAGAASATGDLQSASVVLTKLQRLYSGRGDVAWGASRLDAATEEFVEGADILAAAEREIFAPLDACALAEVEAASRRVATITALVPMALADVATALYSNVYMIRRIAEIYGGRSGAFGAWRLTRAVIGHLAATGAVAVGDDLIGSALGGGVLSKLSRRFGEGVINGALTARVGVAAIEVCRPLPYHAGKRPSVTALVRRALTGLFGQG